MKTLVIISVGLYLLLCSSCQKNTFPKIPSISQLHFGPDSIRVNLDTAYLQFHFTDGQADLGNDPNATTLPIKYDIYIKDFRYDTAFVGYFFPAIDHSIEDSKKGIEGTCTFLFIGPSAITPRPDSLHMLHGDTTHFEYYIQGRSGDTSNHIVTVSIIVRP